MANVIDGGGIQIQTVSEILNELKKGTGDYPGMETIYGDINVEPNSPDGQMLNIVAQAKRDTLEFIQQIFTGFDPDQAVGVVLDQRCALNGVQRNVGTKTTVSITVTASQALTLAGLSTVPLAPFTISDAAGTQYQLVTTYVFVAAAAAALVFQATNIGATTPTANSITTIVTITLGVASVNNPVVALTVGADEESDFALRIRRSKSVALSSKGYFEGLHGALVNVEGVNAVNLLENTTNATDANGIPGHSIWAIVAGGLDADIGKAIYIKRNAGCGMKGAVSVNITQIDASIFAVLFDRPTEQNLWLQATVHAVLGTVDGPYIKAQLVAATQGTLVNPLVNPALLARLYYTIGQTAVTADIVAFINAIAPNASVSVEGVSTDGIAFDWLVAPTGINFRFTTLADRTAINVV